MQRFGMEDIDDYDHEINKDRITTDDCKAIGQDMYRLLKGKQIQIVDQSFVL